MKRSWFRRVAIDLAAVVAVVLLAFWATAPHVVREEDADRVEIGMKRWQVERLFGRPPDVWDDYYLDTGRPAAAGIAFPGPGGRREPVAAAADPPAFAPTPAGRVASWQSPEGQVDVFFVKGEVHHVLAWSVKGPWWARLACRFGFDKRLGWPDE